MMDPTSIALIGIGVMLVLMMLGIPIAFAMLIVGLAGIAVLLNINAALQLLPSTLWGSFSSYSLTVIPIFILMGQIAYHSGMTERLYRSAHTWFGRMPGGIAATTLATCAGFAAICGSNTATAATMGSVALPEMQRYRYSSAISAGSIAVGGTLGAIIPPSVVLIVIAVQTQQSVLKLFLASLIPGIALLLLMIVSVIFACWYKPELGPAGERSSLTVKIKSLGGALEAFILFFLVIGGMILGLFTPTEAGAAGAFAALCIGVLRGRIKLKEFILALDETLRISAMVVLLVTGAVLFGKFLVLTRLPFVIADWASALDMSGLSVLIIILLIYLIGGAIMDALGFLVVSLPVFFPVAMAFGFDPIWFTVLLALVTTLGAVTPPVGVNVYIISSFIPDVPIRKVFIGSALFSVAYLLCTILVIIFPGIVLFLPNLM